MVVRGQLIADIVEQGRGDHLLVRAFLHRARGGLKGMPQPADRIALQRMIELAQLLEHPVGETHGVLALGLIEQQVILAGAVLHPPKAHDAAHALRLA